MTNAAQVAALLEEDLRNLRDPRVRASIQAFRLPTPRLIRLAWDYGKPGDTYDGWLVFEDLERRVGIAYCEQGFGPKNAWGLINVGESCPSMGMDSRWFRRFMDAYLDSFSATDLPIWRVARWTKGDTTREHITEELSWEEAWGIVRRLAEDDVTHAYQAEHAINY